MWTSVRIHPKGELILKGRTIAVRMEDGIKVTEFQRIEALQ
jgi:hypothetical protein